MKQINWVPIAIRTSEKQQIIIQAKNPKTNVGKFTPTINIQAPCFPEPELLMVDKERKYSLSVCRMNNFCRRKRAQN